MNAVNFVSPRSWLTCSHWFLAFGLLVGHWWHSGRSHAVASRLAFGLSRVYEPVLFLRPVDWSKQDLRLAVLSLSFGTQVHSSSLFGSKPCVWHVNSRVFPRMHLQLARLLNWHQRRDTITLLHWLLSNG